MRDDVRRIDDAVSRAERSLSAAPDAMDVIAFISHNLKGQAAPPVYPLLTEIAQSLYRFVASDKSPVPKRLDVVEAHARALEIVVARRICGDGGENGKKSRDALDAAVEKALARK